jgi:hypothetical protein
MQNMHTSRRAIHKETEEVSSKILMDCASTGQAHPSAATVLILAIKR